MTKRIILAIIIALMMVLCACGEGSFNSTSEDYKEAMYTTSVEEDVLYEGCEPFTIVCEGFIEGTNLYQYVMYDPYNRVMYTYITQSKFSGTGIMLENSDGTPRVYSSEDNMTFKLVSEGYIEDTNMYQYIMYDPYNQVMYTYITQSKFSGTGIMLENSDGTPRVYSSEDNMTFKLVSEGYIEDTNMYQYIMYDPYNQVMYSYITKSRFSGTGMMLENSDGTPRVYSSEDNMTFKLVSEEFIEDTNMYQYIMYDPYNQVMYSYITKSELSGTAMTLENSNGNPRVYSPK